MSRFGAIPVEESGPVRSRFGAEPVDDGVNPSAETSPRADGSDFVAGAQAGWESLKSLMYGAKGAFGQAIGDEGMQQSGIEQMQRHEEFANQAGQGRITRYEDVKGVGDFVDYAQYTLGQLTPFALESAATALAGAVAGSTAGPAGTVAGGVAGLTAKTAVKEAIKRYVRGEVMEDAEKAIARNALAKAGGSIGAVVGSYPVAVGDVYNETVQAGDPSAGTAFAAAVPYTALDVIPEVRGIRKIMDGTKGGIISRIGKTAATQAPMEAAAETGQEEVLIQTRGALDPSYDTAGEEANSRRLNSAIAGGLGGAAFGGVAGIRSTQDDEANANRDADNVGRVMDAPTVDDALAAASAAIESPAAQPLDPFAGQVAAQDAERQAQIDAAMPNQGAGIWVNPALRAQTYPTRPGPSGPSGGAPVQPPVDLAPVEAATAAQPFPAPESPVMPQDVAPPAADAPVVQPNGQPYASKAAAALAIKSRKLKGYAPVQVAGGYALAQSETGLNQPISPAADAQAPAAQAAPAASQPGYTPASPSFAPTHELPDGTQVIANTDDAGQPIPGEWLDAGGMVIEDGSAVPLTTQPLTTQQNPVAEKPGVQPTIKSASWVIRNKRTGEVIMETFDRKKVEALNTDKYEAVPILQYLQEFNRNVRESSQPEPAKPVAVPPSDDPVEAAIGAHTDKTAYQNYLRGRLGKPEFMRRKAEIDARWDAVHAGAAPQAAGQAAAEEPQQLTVDRRQKKRPVPKSKDQRSGSERRQDTETRKRVGEMTPDEMRAALLVDDLTGLGNRRAYNESDKLPFQVAIDLDGLKFINDTYGHDAGDQFIAAYGEAVLGVTSDGYHLSGDEFMVQAINESAAIRIMREIEAAAADLEIAVTITKTGEEATVSGVKFSYGIGQDKTEADKRLYEHKAERKQAGLRQDREPDDGGTTEAPPAAHVQGSAQEEEVTQIPPPSGVSVSGDGIRRGEVGIKLAAGEVVLTAAGRKTSPFPKVDTSSDRKTGNTLKRVDAWLMENAIAEAASRGDDFNRRQFHDSLNNPSQADKDRASVDDQPLSEEVKARIKSSLGLPNQPQRSQGAGDEAVYSRKVPFSGITEQANRDEALDPLTGEAIAVQSGIEGKTPKEAARWLIKNGSKQHATIAERVLLQLGRLDRAGVKLDLKVAHIGDEVPIVLTRARGVTDWRFATGNNRITVWLNGADVTGKVGVSHETLLHELVHMATVGVVHLGNLKAAAGTKTAADVTDLYAVTNHIIRHYNQRVANFKAGKADLTDFEQRMYGNANNAFRDPDEVLAWGLTSADAQAYLESIPYPKHNSAWSAFVSAIRNLLGIPGNAETALSEVLRIAENLMSDNVNDLLGLDTIDGQNTVIQSASGSGQLPQIIRKALATPASAYADLDATLFDELRFKAQDKFHYLNKVQKAAMAGRGISALPEAEDAYLAELRYHGMAGAAIEDFQREHLDPLAEAISAAGVGMEDVNLYLQARHAPEANAQLERINPDRPDNQALSGMSNEEAAEIIARLDSPAMQDIGRRVDAITKARREMLIESGLETRETVDAWESAYQHYVPLKREGFDGRLPSKGMGFNTRGKEKRRAGSNREVVHVLANVVAQYEATAIKAEKVKVGKAFLEFARNNQNPDLYEVDKVEYKPTFDAEGLVTYREDRGFIMADNVLVVRVDGVDHRITFNNQSPVAMRIAHAMNNLGATESGPIVNALSKLTRWLAIVNTGANPEFVISNFARDLQTAGYNLSATAADKLKWKIIKDVGKSWRGIRSFQKQDGKHHEWAQYFDEFRKAGAQTGWLQAYSNIEDREQALIQKIRDMGRDTMGLKVKAGMKAVIEFIENENTAVENAIRLSAFVHARRAGMTEAQAAKIAKEMTVNFNRKGDMGQVLNALYLFYNASIQGSVRLLQAVAKSRKVQIMAGATIIFAAVLDMINRSLGGDDDDGEAKYDKIPDFVKERNLIIMLPSGGGDYIKIPLPWGYNVLHVMGQGIGEALTQRDFRPGKSAMRVAASAVSAFNPIGGSESLLQFLSPTITDPMVQWAENKDWAGKPLRPASNPFGVDTPNSQKYWNSVRAPSKWVTDQLNKLDLPWIGIHGGDEVRPGAIDISPEAIDLIVDTFTGGAGRFVSDTIAAPMKALTGEELETYEVPVLRKVYGAPGMGTVVSDFYERMESVQITDKQLKHYKGDSAKIAEIRRKHFGEVRLLGDMKIAQSQLRKLRKQIKLYEKSGNESALKIAREREKEIMRRFNKAYNNKMGRFAEAS